MIARESGSPSAGKTRGALIQVLAWAMQAGLAETNPAIVTPSPAASRPRDRVLDDEELAAVWHASGDDDYGRIVATADAMRQPARRDRRPVLVRARFRCRGVDLAARTVEERPAAYAADHADDARDPRPGAAVGDAGSTIRRPRGRGICRLDYW